MNISRPIRRPIKRKLMSENGYTREQRAVDLRKRLEVYRRICKELDCENTTLRIQRNHMQSLLLAILEGSDREAAMEKARIALQKIFARNGGYDLHARIVNEIIPNALAQIAEDRLK